MRTITFVTQKGGTGKTTLATNLAVAAQEAGERVALLDLDPQSSTVSWGLRREKARLAAERASKTDLEAKLSAPHVEAFPLKRIAELPKIISVLEKEFSLVILDTPGTDSVVTHHAMSAATLCLVPTQPTAVEAEAMLPTIKALMSGDHAFATILNRCLAIPNNSRAAEMAAGLKTFGLLVEPYLSTRADYQDAYAEGRGVTELAPKGKAAEEIRALWANVAIMVKKPVRPSKLPIK